MRITDTNKIGSAGSIKKKSKTDASGDFGGLIDSTSETESASPLGGVSPIASMAGLLAVQEAGNHFEAIAKQMTHGKNLLDILDELRFGLLNGSVTANNAQKLVSELRENHNHTDDAELESIINEIEIRAEVELAKLEVSKSV